MKKALLLWLVFSTNSFALETDQFHAAFHDIRESSSPLNAYVEEKMNKALVSAKPNISCAEISDAVMTEIVGKYSISAISSFAKSSPDIDRYPDDSVGMQSYLNQSIYKDAGFPFLLFGVISKTINVGGVYIGTDKLGHFALIGRNYYRRFLELKAKGLTDSEAEKESVMKGIQQEVHLLGYTLGGVLSFGDLEANFQGMQFARSLCNGENPYLLKRNSRWVKNPERTFDIKNYINPKMDESFWPPLWKARIWKDIVPALSEVYCSLRLEESYQARIKKYKSQINMNRNDDYVREFFSTKSQYDRTYQDLEKLCQ